MPQGQCTPLRSIPSYLAGIDKPTYQMIVVTVDSRIRLACPLDLTE